MRNMKNDIHIRLLINMQIPQNFKGTKVPPSNKDSTNSGCFRFNPFQFGAQFFQDKHSNSVATFAEIWPSFTLQGLLSRKANQNSILCMI